MSKFKIKVARIEAASGRHADSRVCIRFQIDRGTVNFRVPIRLKVSDYDGTEMVQAARSTPHRTVVEQRPKRGIGSFRPKSCGCCRA